MGLLSLEFDIRGSTEPTFGNPVSVAGTIRTIQIWQTGKSEGATIHILKTRDKGISDQSIWESAELKKDHALYKTFNDESAIEIEEGAMWTVMVLDGSNDGDVHVLVQIEVIDD